LDTLCDKYDLAEEQLKSFTRSRVRTKILLSLLSGEMTANDLESKLGTRVTTILHSLKDMVSSNIIEKTAHSRYRLTNLGRMQAYRVEHAINFALVLENHEEFWLNHDISGIPPSLMENIGMLAQSEIISSNSTNILKTVDLFLKELKEAKEIHGVSPIFVPGFAETMTEVVQKGIEVELILTEALLDIVLKQHARAINELLTCDNFSVYVIKSNITIAFTVTDSFISLGLFRLDGGYDLGSDLICIGESAVAWGDILFKHYRDIAKPLKIRNV
jgi:predicted transcriptional regulator